MVTVNNHRVKLVDYCADDRYVTSSRGTIPVILTAPHGGYLGFNNVPSRQVELPSTCVLPDTMTAELLDDTTEHLRSVGVQPYVVKALIHRKYCDLNRPPAEAFEGPEMERYYIDYHNTIEEFIEEIITKTGRVPVLLDVHGQGYMLLCTIRGTHDGATCAYHRGLHGDEFLTGPDSLFAHLEEQDVDVDPPVGLPLTMYPLEITTFRGGYTVMRYSGIAHRDIVLKKPYPYTVSAIQLETGFFQRKDRVITTAFASKLGTAIKRFCAAFDLL